MNSISKIIIEIGGQQLNDFEEISINQSMYGIDSFEIKCRFDSLEKADGFILEKSKDFLGMPIVIQTKSNTNDSEEDALIFKGYITEVKGNRRGMFDNDVITISGGSEEILLQQKPTSRVFLDKTLEEIIKEVLKSYPLKSKIKPRESQRFNYIVQYEENDLDFLKRLSIRYGEWFFYNGKELIFGDLPTVENSLTLGYNLDEINYELRILPLKTTLLAIDPFEIQVQRYTPGTTNVDPNMNIYGKHAYKQSNKFFNEKSTNYYEHLNVAETDYKQALDRVGEIEETSDAINLTDLSGASTNSSLIPGVRTGVKSGWGLYLITSVQHHFNNMLTYQNTFTAIPAESTMPEYANPNYIRQSSTQVAKVMDNKDPEKLGRIKVAFPWMENGETTPWIRMVSPYVGKNFGFYFIPPIDSAVFIDFESGDVERPFCSGAFFDKRNEPDSGWTGNYREQDAKMQVIRTSGGNTIEFEDIESDSGKIKIYTSDSKNSITLDNDNGTLTIHADGSLKLNADKIDMDARSGIKMNSDAGIEIMAKKEMKVDVMDKLNLTSAAAVNCTFGSDFTITVGGNYTGNIASSYTMMIGASSGITIGASSTTTAGGNMQFVAPIITIN